MEAKKGAVEFSVSPWVSASDRANEERAHGSTTEHDVHFVNLIADPHSHAVKQREKGATMKLVAGEPSAWVLKKPEVKNDVSDLGQPNAPLAQRSPARDEEDFDDLPISPSTGNLEGKGHLILLPSGSISGQIIIDGMATTSLPLIGKVISQGAQEAKLCEFDPSSAILSITLINDNKEVKCYVCQTGGDFACLSPAEAWQLRECGVEIDNEEWDEVALHFSPELLLQGEASEDSIRAINRKLMGKGCVVVIGVMKIEHLPSTFLKPPESDAYSDSF